MKRYTVVGVILLVLAVVAVLGCADTNTEYQPGNVKETPAGPTISLLSHELVYQDGLAEVTGEAKALENLSYAEVDVKFYDSEHRLIFSGFTNVVDLKQGDVWLFTVWGPYDQVESYEIQIKDTAL